MTTQLRAKGVYVNGVLRHETPGYVPGISIAQARANAAILPTLDKPLFGYAMAGESGNGFIVTDTFHSDSRAGWKAFDADLATGWYPFYNFSAELIVECPSSRKLGQFRLTHDINNAHLGYAPNLIHIYGSNDKNKTQWTTLFNAKVSWTSLGGNLYATPSLSTLSGESFKFFKVTVGSDHHPYVIVYKILLSDKNTPIVI